MPTRENYDFARQAGAAHVVVHLVDYFKGSPANPRDNQPTSGKYEPWGQAGDPPKLWGVEECHARERDPDFRWLPGPTPHLRSPDEAASTLRPSPAFRDCPPRPKAPSSP